MTSYWRMVWIGISVIFFYQSACNSTENLSGQASSTVSGAPVQSSQNEGNSQSDNNPEPESTEGTLEPCLYEKRKVSHLIDMQADSSASCHGETCIVFSKEHQLATEGTLSFWIKSNDYPSLNTLPFYIMDSDIGEVHKAFRIALYSLYRQGESRKLTFNATTELNKGNTLSFSIDDWGPNQSHHLVVTWNEDLVAIYQDGLLMDSQKLTPEFRAALKEKSKNVYLLGSKRNGYAIDSSDSIPEVTFDLYDQFFDSTDVSDAYAYELENNGPILRSGSLTYQFHGAQDGFNYSLIKDTSKSKAIVDESIAKKLWEIHLQNEETDQIIPITNETMNTLPECTYDKKYKKMIFTWQDILLKNQDQDQGALNVTLTFDASIDNQISSYIDIKVNSDVWNLIGYALPTEGLISNDHPMDLIIPQAAIGKKYEDIFSLLWPKQSWELLPRYPSVDLSMQWLGFVSDQLSDFGIYLGAHDPNGTTKSFYLASAGTVKGSDKSSFINVGLVVHTSKLKQYTQNWPFVFKLAPNNWYALTQEYRNFALSDREILNRPPLYKNKKNISWLAEAGWFRTSQYETARFLDGDIKNEMKSVHATSQLSSDGLIFWHSSLWQAANNYEKISYKQMNDNPTYEPWPERVSQWSDAKKNNMPVSLYFNPIQWDASMDSPYIPASWNDKLGIDSAKKDENNFCFDGAHQTVSCYEAKTKKGESSYYVLEMCPWAESWHQIMNEAIGNMASFSGIKGIYLDVLTAAKTSPCYDKSHNHELGFGDNQVLGMRGLLDKLKDTAHERNPQMAFYSEGFSDAYINQVSGYYVSTHVSLGSALPLAQAVYHDYAVFMGWTSSLKHQSELSILAQQGLFFNWGGMPGDLLYDDIRSPKYVNILKKIERLAIARRLFADYLVYGQMMGNVNAVDTKLRYMPLGRFGSEDLVVPQVAVSAWRTPANEFGLVISSLESESRNIEIPILRSEWGLDKMNYRLEIQSVENNSLLTIIDTQETKIKLQVNAHENYLLRFIPL